MFTCVINVGVVVNKTYSEGTHTHCTDIACVIMPHFPLCTTLLLI